MLFLKILNLLSPCEPTKEDVETISYLESIASRFSFLKSISFHIHGVRNAIFEVKLTILIKREEVLFYKSPLWQMEGFDSLLTVVIDIKDLILTYLVWMGLVQFPFHQFSIFYMLFWHGTSVRLIVWVW